MLLGNTMHSFCWSLIRSDFFLFLGKEMICLFLFSKAGFGKELYRVEGLQWTMCDRSQLLWFNQHLLNVKGLQSTSKSENILCPATHTHTHTQISVQLSYEIGPCKIQWPIEILAIFWYDNYPHSIHTRCVN